MRLVLLVLLAACGLPQKSFAQVPSIVEGTTLQVRPGQWHQVIRNQSQSELVAYWAPFHCPKAGPVAVADALLNNGNHEIPPGESTEIHAGDPSRCSGGVTAAVFSDGHAEGDPQALDAIYSTRRGAYKALGECIEVLNAIQNEREPLQQALDTLKTRYQASLRDRSKGAPGYAEIYSYVVKILSDPRWGHAQLPPDKRKKAPAVEEVMAATGLARDEASAVVLAKRLEEWKALLGDNLQPRQ